MGFVWSETKLLRLDGNMCSGRSARSTTLIDGLGVNIVRLLVCEISGVGHLGFQVIVAQKLSQTRLQNQA